VRRLILLMAAMAAALVAASGVAYALTFTCGDLQTDPDPGGECTGTPQDDIITGTSESDTIHGRSGSDQLFGELGNDTLFGDGRGDTLSGGGGSNQYHGASGPDTIIANESSGLDEVEEIFAGPGNDVINAFDGQPDVIDCGSGADRVSIDSADDLALNCLDRIRAARLPAND
jgi:RTX calcium-binding nonapeptide repeat (4 copies)